MSRLAEEIAVGAGGAGEPVAQRDPQGPAQTGHRREQFARALEP